MKKIIAFTLVFVMLFSLSACDIQGAVEDAVLGAVENQAEKMNAELGRSKAEGNVLSVESVGITFVKPYSWEFLEDDAIKEMVGTAGDVLEIGDFASKIAETKTVYDAVAKDPVSGANIIFMYENLAIGKQEKITIEQYVRRCAGNRRFCFQNCRNENRLRCGGKGPCQRRKYYIYV